MCFCFKKNDKITKQAPKKNQGLIVYLLWSLRLAFVVMMTHPLSADRISGGLDLHMTQSKKVDSRKQRCAAN